MDIPRVADSEIASIPRPLMREAKMSASTRPAPSAWMKIIAIAAATVLQHGAAGAADLGNHQPALPAMVYNWTGIYVGANFGGVFAFEDVTTPLGGSLTDPSGIMGGTQFGYNYQFSNWLIGIEGEFAGTSAQGTTNFVGPLASTAVTVDQNWYGTLSGRLGYAMGPLLVYAKGGGAWMNADYRYSVNSGINGANAISSTRSGWNAGAGLEYLMTQRWSAKLEYDYLGFGTETLNFGIPLGAATTFKTQINEVKVGLNYRWGP